MFDGDARRAPRDRHRPRRGVHAPASRRRGACRTLGGAWMAVWAPHYGLRHAPCTPSPPGAPTTD